MSDEIKPTGNIENKWRKYLFNEFAFIGVVISLTLSVNNFINQPANQNAKDISDIKTSILLIQKDITNINQNHEAHIQDIMQQLKDHNDEIAELNKVESTQNQDIIALLQALKISVNTIK